VEQSFLSLGVLLPLSRAAMSSKSDSQPPTTKKQKVKAKATKTGTTTSKPVAASVASAQLSEIDDLFSGAKKRKSVSIENPDEITKKAPPKKAKSKVKNTKSPQFSEDDSDDPDVDPYYEFIDDDDGSKDEDGNATYGLINNAYNPGKIINPEAPLERIQDGVPVYKAHLLKVGEGGGTPLCPFDCNCCF
jgi:hypothetical protein